MIGVRPRLEDLSPRGWTLFAASAFGFGGTIVAALILTLVFDADLLNLSANSGIAGLPNVVGAGLGAFLLGAYFWWTIIESPRTISTFQGVAAGLLTGIVSHFVMWLFGGASVYIADAAWNSAGSSVSALVLTSAGMTFFSVLAFGLVTGTAGGVIGWALARLRRSSFSDPPSSGSNEPESE